MTVRRAGVPPHAFYMGATKTGTTLMSQKIGTVVLPEKRELQYEQKVGTVVLPEKGVLQCELPSPARNHKLRPTGKRVLSGY